MVVIRMARGGAKKKPFYYIVAADKRRARDSRFLERLGFFNPVATGQAEALRLNIERIDYWLENGAQPSERVAGLIKSVKTGVSTKKNKLKKKANPAAEEAAPVEAEAETPPEADADKA